MHTTCRPAGRNWRNLVQSPGEKRRKEAGAGPRVSQGFSRHIIRKGSQQGGPTRRKPTTADRGNCARFGVAESGGAGPPPARAWRMRAVVRTFMVACLEPGECRRMDPRAEEHQQANEEVFLGWGTVLERASANWRSGRFFPRAWTRSFAPSRPSLLFHYLICNTSLSSLPRTAHSSFYHCFSLPCPRSSFPSLCVSLFRHHSAPLSVPISRRPPPSNTPPFLSGLSTPVLFALPGPRRGFPSRRGPD